MGVASGASLSDELTHIRVDLRDYREMFGFDGYVQLVG